VRNVQSWSAVAVVARDEVLALRLTLLTRAGAAPPRLAQGLASLASDG
jgi:hypothetical protein